MADKLALSKEQEEQIQGLAGEIYLQIEEKTGHFISAARLSR